MKAIIAPPVAFVQSAWAINEEQKELQKKYAEAKTEACNKHKIEEKYIDHWESLSNQDKSKLAEKYELVRKELEPLDRKMYMLNARFQVDTYAHWLLALNEKIDELQDEL